MDENFKFATEGKPSEITNEITALEDTQGRITGL